MTLVDFGYPVKARWFTCSYGIDVTLVDFGYPVKPRWFTCDRS